MEGCAKGYSWSQWSLGKCFLRGAKEDQRTIAPGYGGLTFNSSAARELFVLASEQGNEFAKLDLLRLDGIDPFQAHAGQYDDQYSH
jgi:hypothetical protein